MERLPASKKIAIMRDFFGGVSYDDSAAKNRVSKGSVVNIIDQIKAGNFPETTDVVDQVDILRELAVELKHLNKTPAQCLAGLAILEKTNQYGLSPADINRWTLILKSATTEEEAKKLIETIYSIQEVLQRTGLSFEELDDKVHNLEKKASDLEPLSSQYKNTKKQLGEMKKQKEDLAQEVARLEEKRKTLAPFVDDLEKRKRNLTSYVMGLEPRATKSENILADFSKTKRDLDGVGFTFEALADFNQGLKSIAQRRKIPVEKLRNRLLEELENLDEAVGLETLIQSDQQKLENQEKSIAAANQEQKSLMTANARLKDERVVLETTIRETREKVANEITGLVPVASATVNKLVKELRQAQEEALNKFRELESEHKKAMTSLKGEEIVLKSSIQEAVESGKQLMQTVQDEVLSLVGNAAIKMADEIEEWGNARSELGAYLEDIKRARYFTKIPLTNDALESFVSDINSITIGCYLQITIAWCIKNVKHKVRPPKWVQREYFINELRDFEVADLVKWALETFIEGESGESRI